MDNPTLISVNDRYVQAIYHGGGTLRFAFDFPIYAPSSVQLFVDNALWKFTEDYTVTVVENEGGFIDLLKEPADGATLTLVGATPLVRTEYYVPPTADVTALNAELDKTLFRLQQIDRDLLGCLKNRRDETEIDNTVLPKTLERLGKFAVWGSDSGRLTYAGDPTEGGDDPTTDYARTYNNLSDLTDPAAARENLAIVQGHAINGLAQRPNLIFTGDAVSTVDAPGQLATLVTLNSRVKTFADIWGILPIVQGGTGANNAGEARKNLGLLAVAHTANFYDLNNIPPIVHHISNTGTGTGVFAWTINGIASLLSLTSDGTVAISKVQNGNAIELAVSSVPMDRLSGILPPHSGGTGLGTNDLAIADAGTVPTLTANRTFTLQTPSTGHEIFFRSSLLPQRRRLRFEGDGVTLADDSAGNATVVSLSGSDGTIGRYFAHRFFSSEFQNDVLIVPQSAIPFPIVDPLLFVRDDFGNYVETGTSVLNGSHVQIIAQPFDGKLLICEPGGNGFGLFASIPFSENDFSDDRLEISQDAVPFDLVDPLVEVLDDGGAYVNCAIAVANYISLTLRAKPFSGKVLLFRGDLEQVFGRHKILAPNGDVLPDRLSLQFTGPGVQSVTDNRSDGKTVVTISGGGGSGGKLATVEFTEDDFNGTQLVLPAVLIPFSYVTPIVQVTNVAGQYGIAAVTVDPDTLDIVVEGEPFAGKIILMSN
ncbi:MAG: hypothetical protein LBT98_03445 [Puniceicoccales bacterium]|jgi:hypothetical protein|nr:hypothetical protein [Puniceicoccales bacterium]